MPLLLAEEIMQTVVSVLDAALAANVYRGRVDPVPDSKLPAVGVFQGGEDPLGEFGRLNMGFIDEVLEVRTEVADRAVSGQIETVLNELRRQVHLVLMADAALGLSYVIDIEPAGTDEPELDGSADKVSGTLVCNWLVHYRHQHADAGAAP